MTLNRKASLLFIAAFSLYIGLSLALGYALPEGTGYTGTLIANALVVSIPAFLIPAIVFRRRNGFELFAAPPPPHALIAIALGVGCMLLNLALVSLTSALTYGLEIRSTALDVRESLKGSNFFVMLICVALIPALSEEYLMRGALLEAWRRCSPVWAAVFTALFFALLHLSPSNFIVYFAMGMLFAAVYNITRNVWMTVVIHFMNNFFSVLLAMRYLGNDGGAASAAAAQAMEYTRADYFASFVNMAIIAAAVIAPMLFLLKISCRKRSMGMYALTEGAAESSVGASALLTEPLLWVTAAVLLLLNLLFGLIEFGVITLAE